MSEMLLTTHTAQVFGFCVHLILVNKQQLSEEKNHEYVKVHFNHKDLK